MKLSIVTPLYRSASYLEEYYRRVTACAERIVDSHEVILVNDGSPDSSLTLALDLQKRDQRVVVIDLSRNFGHHQALMTGISNSRGEYVFVIDCDLDEPPETLDRFWQILSGSGDDIDVVFGVEQRRTGTVVDRLAGRLLYFLLNRAGNIEVPDNMLVARLMTRRYVDGLLQFRDIEPVLGVTSILTGFGQKPVPVERARRKASTYSLGLKMDLAQRMVTGFGTRPLWYVLILGAAVFLMSLLYALVLSLQAPVSGIEGWQLVILSVWLIGGLVLVSVGVVAVYLARVVAETARRPSAVVRRVYTAGQIPTDD